MNPIADLLDIMPDARIGESDPIGRRFRGVGVTTFDAACRWVRDLPYGPNHGGRDPATVFDELRGTCQSKHSLIAALALELGLPVTKYLGTYRLDESLVDGAGDLLAAHRLTFVPRMHCVLKYGERFIDLTAGNCHGKKRDITDMDMYFRVDPLASEIEEQRIYELAVRYYQQIDPVLACKSIDEIRRIAAACAATPSVACR